MLKLSCEDPSFACHVLGLFCKYLPDWSTTSSIQLLVEPCTNWSDDFASWLVNVTGAKNKIDFNDAKNNKWYVWMSHNDMLSYVVMCSHIYKVGPYQLQIGLKPPMNRVITPVTHSFPIFLRPFIDVITPFLSSTGPPWWKYPTKSCKLKALEKQTIEQKQTHTFQRSYCWWNLEIR